MRNVAHLLVGYDPVTEKVEYENTIPDLKVTDWVKPDSDDPDALDSYKLDYSVAKDIMSFYKLALGDSRLEYFMESKALVTA